MRSSTRTATSILVAVNRLASMLRVLLRLGDGTFAPAPEAGSLTVRRDAVDVLVAGW